MQCLWAWKSLLSYAKSSSNQLCVIKSIFVSSPIIFLSRNRFLCPSGLFQISAKLQHNKVCKVEFVKTNDIDRICIESLRSFLSDRAILISVPTAFNHCTVSNQYFIIIFVFIRFCGWVFYKFKCSKFVYNICWVNWLLRSEKKFRTSK